MLLATSGIATAQTRAFGETMNRGFAAIEAEDAAAAAAAFQAALLITPGHPAALAWLGNARRLEGDLSTALRRLDEAVTAAPDYYPARLFRAQAREQAGHVGEAIDDLRAAVQLDSADPTARASLARLLMRTGRLEEAAAQADELIRLAPDVFAAHYLLATVQQQRQRHSAALTAFLEADALQPGERTVLFGIADALAGLGRVEDAFGALARLVETHPDYPYGWRRYAELLAANRFELDARIAAADFYTRALELQPGELDVVRPLAALYLELRLFQRVQRLVEAAPRAESDAEIQFLLGKAQAQMRAHESALRTYDRAFELSPRADILAYRAASERNLDRPDAALATLRSAVELDPGYGPAWVDVGDLLLHQDQLAEATTALQNAVGLLPEHGQAHYLLGQALRRSGDPAGAVRELERAAELDETNANAFYNLGLAYRENGDAERSRVALERFQELERTSGRGAEQERRTRARGLLRTGLVQYRLGDNADAAGTLRQATELAPDAEPAWYYLGLSLANERDIAGAIEALERAVSLAPDRLGSHDALATLYEQVGRADDAAAARARAAQLRQQAQQPVSARSRPRR